MVFSYPHPILFCLCGPSGSGKSTLCWSLARAEESVTVSISTTTRAPRANEVDGQDYFFVSNEEFASRIAAGRFIEHAVFNGNQYGTETINIERVKDARQHILFDIEVEGVKQLKQIYVGHVVTIFVFPSSMEILKQRLASRGTNSPEDVANRLCIAERELNILRDPQFSDYIVVNDILENAHTDALAIIRSEMLRISRIQVDAISKLLT